LARLGFADSAALRRRVDHLARPEVQPVLAEALPYLLLALSDAASPDRAWVNLERCAAAVADQAAFYHYLASEPRAIEMLITLFAGSQYLTEILLRNPEYFPRLTERHGAALIKGREEFVADAQQAVAPFLDDGRPTQSALDALRRFQQWKLLRIGLSDLTGLLDLSSVTLQLSYLADAIVQVCLAMVTTQTELRQDGFVVLAMGKLGGGELNYSSDIDLLFLAANDATAYRRVGERLIKLLTEVTATGFLYRVDMRLRPWGKVGPLVVSVDGYLAYLQKHARLWEKQALLKARPIAGNEAIGAAFLSSAEPLLFEAQPEIVRADVHAMKQLTEDQLRQRGREWGEVKLGKGSIRDVEFVTQYLQLAYGGQHARLRTANTLDALTHLADHGFLPKDERRILADGYVFLRTVEHYLQVLDYRQTYTLPATPAELSYLAQRLGFAGPDAAARFVTRYQQHSAAIRTIYQRHLDPHGWDTRPRLAAGPATSNEVITMESPATSLLAPDDQTASAAGVNQHLARLTPVYTAIFDESAIQRHADLAERLTNQNPVEVRAEPLGEDLWRVTIVGFDYLGELSLICGLLFVYGFSIIEGNVFTYEPKETAPATPGSGARRWQTGRGARPDERRKIVDVFTVRAMRPDSDPGIWLRYEGDLAALLRLLQGRRQTEAQGELAKRVGVAVARGEIPGTTPTLQPVAIEIDNDASARYTILRIEAPDTIGFLYEFTNALALSGIHIAQVAVTSAGNHVHDTLYITDAQGRKIEARDKQRELRAASVLVKHFTHLLPYSPNPEAALVHFHEYLGELFRRPNWPDELASLERPEVLSALAQLLGVSHFLWDDFLRMQHENLFPVVRDMATLPLPKSKSQLEEELALALDQAQGAAVSEQARRAAWRDELNAFKDREMFRVDMRNILNYIPNPAQFSAELTDLVETVLEAVYRRCDEELRAQFGQPQQEGGQPSMASVCALGKSGGRELGYASDIELLFIYAANGVTAGPRVTTTAEYYERLVQETVRAIRARREGIFEIDLQLRPYGKAGSLAVSLAAFRRYFAPGGAAWSYERQALIKLRPIAGDPQLGEQIQTLRDQYVYQGDPFDVAGMRAMRERQLRHLVTPGTINAKYSLGGLVDVEYLVQGLQMLHGGVDPSVRLCNTSEAMAALAWTGVISPDDYARLRSAHVFLQRLIDALRVVRGNNKDLTVPPHDSEEFAFLARRLGYSQSPALLAVDLTEHITWLQNLSIRLLG
jgi:glutamate-ammonia-ligase adenylyltransferase